MGVGLCQAFVCLFVCYAGSFAFVTWRCDFQAVPWSLVLYRLSRAAAGAGSGVGRGQED